MGAKLKRERLEWITPGIVSAMLAVLPAVAAGILAGSPSHAGGSYFLAFGVIGVGCYGVPPWHVAHRFYVLLALFSLSAVGVSVWCVPEPWPLVSGFAFSCVGVLLAFAQTVEIAFRNFKMLQEIQAIGPAMRRRLDAGLIASHVTDVHITAADDRAQIGVGGGAGGHERLQEWLTAVRPLKPPYLIVSGDVTDTGDKVEWRRFNERVRRLIGSGSRLIIAPGNHDLASEYGTGGRGKLRLYFEAQALWCPHLLTPGGVRAADTLCQAEKETGPYIKERAAEMRQDFIELRGVIRTGGPGAGREITVDHPVLLGERIKIAERANWPALARDELLDEWFEGRWYDLFPLHVFDRDRKLVVVVLNSVLRSAATLGDSALGALGEDQMERLGSMLDSLPSWIRDVFIVTHHAPFRRPGEWRLLLQKSGSSKASVKRMVSRIVEFAILAQGTKEARRLVNTVSAAADKYQAADFFLLCGHRHGAAAGHAGRAVVLEGAALAEGGAVTWLVYADGEQVSVWEEPIPGGSAPGGVVRE